MKRMVISIMILLLVLTGSAVLFAQGQAESIVPESVEPAVQQQGTDETTDTDMVGDQDGNADGLVLQEASGVVITGIIADSAAEHAGLMRGDIILSVNGVETNSMSEIIEAVGELAHGDTVQMTLLRGGDTLQIELILETRIQWPLIGIYGVGSDDVRYGMNGGRNFQGQPGMMDMFRLFDPDNRGSLPYGQMYQFDMGDIPEEVLSAIRDGDAVMISEVVDGSPADVGGIEDQSVLYLVDGKPVSDGDLRSMILGYDVGDKITLTVYHDGNIDEIEVVLGDSDGNPYLGVRYYALAERMQSQFHNFPFTRPDNSFGNRPDGFMPRAFDGVEG